MKKELFNELVESLGEAGKIRKGQLKASRVFEYKPVDVKKSVAGCAFRKISLP